MFTQDLVQTTYGELRRRKSNYGRVYEHRDTKEIFFSVTTFLGATADKEWLADWAETVGKEKAELISRVARERGNGIHEALQDWITTDGTADPKIFAPDVRMLFRSLKPQISKSLSVIKGVELPLYSRGLGLAGTTDVIAVWDGVLSTVDWKNSRNDKHLIDDTVQDYFLQALIYSIMYAEMYGEAPQKLVLPIFVTNGKSVIFTADPNDYIEKLQERRRKFKEIVDAKEIILGDYE